MQQCPRDFQPPHLSAREVANLAAAALSKPDAHQYLVATETGFAPGDAVQRRVIQQVLHHRQVEVECTRLKDNTEQPQRLAGRKADVMTENADAPRLDS